MAIDSLTALQISRGAVAGRTGLFKFGENSEVGSGLETIWSHGGTYIYPTTATSVNVSSSSASDTNVTVTLQGLDENYESVSEDVIIAGQAPVATTTAFLRIFRAFYKEGDTMVGDIYAGTGALSGGVPSVVYARVNADRGQTMMAIYTVPAGYTMFVFDGSFSSGTETGGRYIEGIMRFKGEGANTWRTAISTTLKDGFTKIEFGVPQKFEEKTDVEMAALSSSSTNSVTAHWSAILVKND